MYTIYVDGHREAALAASFKKLPWINDASGTCQLKEQILQDGDIQVFLWEQLILVIERKRIRDLSASCCDGRLQNCFNLDILAQQNQVVLEGQTFRPMTVLLIEGKFQKASKRCLSKKVLESFIDQFSWKIPSLKVHFTADPLASAERILALIKDMPPSCKDLIRKMTEVKVGFSKAETKVEQATFTDEKETKKKRYTLYGNQMKLHQKFLREFSGVSVNIAHMILDAKMTAFDIVLNRVAAPDLAKLRYTVSGRALSPAKCQEICRCATDSIKQKEMLIHLLKKIPHVKNPHAPSVLAKILLSNPGITIKDLRKHPDCQKHSLSLVTLERIYSTVKFHP